MKTLKISTKTFICKYLYFYQLISESKIEIIHVKMLSKVTLNFWFSEYCPQIFITNQKNVGNISSDDNDNRILFPKDECHFISSLSLSIILNNTPSLLCGNIYKSQPNEKIIYSSKFDWLELSYWNTTMFFCLLLFNMTAFKCKFVVCSV